MQSCFDLWGYTFPPVSVFFFHCPCKFAHLVVCFWLGELLVTALVTGAVRPHKTHTRQFCHQVEKIFTSPARAQKKIHGGIICFWLIAEFFLFFAFQKRCVCGAWKWRLHRFGESLETPNSGVQTVRYYGKKKKVGPPIIYCTCWFELVYTFHYSYQVTWVFR